MYDLALQINPNEAITYFNKGKNFSFIFQEILYYI